MSDKNNPLLTLSEQKRALIAQPPPADTHLAAARTNQQPAHAQHLCELNQHPSPLLAPPRVRDIAAPLAPGSRWLGVHTRKGGPASQEGSPSQQPCRNLDFSPATSIPDPDLHARTTRICVAVSHQANGTLTHTGARARPWGRPLCTSVLSFPLRTANSHAVSCPPPHTPPLLGMTSEFSSGHSTHCLAFQHGRLPKGPAPHRQSRNGRPPSQPHHWETPSHPGVTAPCPASIPHLYTASGLGADCETSPGASQQAHDFLQISPWRNREGIDFPERSVMKKACHLRVTEMDARPESCGVGAGAPQLTAACLHATCELHVLSLRWRRGGEGSSMLTDCWSRRAHRYALSAAESGKKLFSSL